MLIIRHDYSTHLFNKDDYGEFGSNWPSYFTGEGFK